MIINRRRLSAASGWILAAGLAGVVAGGIGIAAATPESGSGSSSVSAADSSLAASSSALDAAAGADGGPDGGVTGAAADTPEKARPLRPRVWLWRHVEHGELVVRRQEGHQDTLVQRGQITAVSAESMTVRSADGFAATWTLDDDTRVRKQGRAAKIADLETGDQVAVAGPGKAKTGQAKVVRARD